MGYFCGGFSVRAAGRDLAGYFLASSKPYRVDYFSPPLLLPRLHRNRSRRLRRRHRRRLVYSSEKSVLNCARVY